MDYDQVILDEEAGTVYFEDPALSLDIRRAVARGYAAQADQRHPQENRLDSFCSMRATTWSVKPLVGRDFWVVGVRTTGWRQHP